MTSTDRVRERRHVYTAREDQAQAKTPGKSGGHAFLWAYGRRWLTSIAGLESRSSDPVGFWKNRIKARRGDVDEHDTFQALGLALSIRSEADAAHGPALRVCAAAVRYAGAVIRGGDLALADAQLRLACCSWMQLPHPEADDRIEGDTEEPEILGTVDDDGAEDLSDGIEMDTEDPELY